MSIPHWSAAIGVIIVSIMLNPTVITEKPMSISTTIYSNRQHTVQVRNALDTVVDAFPVSHQCVNKRWSVPGSKDVDSVAVEFILSTFSPLEPDKIVNR